MTKTTTTIIVAVVVAVIAFIAGYYAAPSKTVIQSTTTTQTYTQTVTQTYTQTVVPTTTPELVPVSASSTVVNATKGATLRLGPLIVVIRPGTYALVGNSTLATYNFSLVIYNLKGVGLAPDGGMPVYAFAFAVNGQVSPSITFVDASGKPRQIITLAYIPSTWTSWTWLGYRQLSNGTLVGGRYVFVDQWYNVGGGVQVNLQFVKPVPWVFVAESSERPLSFSIIKPAVNISGVESGLVPLEIAEAWINGTEGGAVRVGNIIAVVPPGTYLKVGNSTYKAYNFSLVYYATLNLPGVDGMAPLGAYAFAANGVVSPAATFVGASGAPTPIITVAILPRTVTSWTWLTPTVSNGQSKILINGSYKFPNVWIRGDGYLLNAQFVKPVPWVFLGPVN
ncbi:hypothetical protein [Thermoproteus tenax]|nr:hypothetical protein [Thermoproteus tenax]